MPRSSALLRFPFTAVALAALSACGGGGGSSSSAAGAQSVGTLTIQLGQDHRSATLHLTSSEAGTGTWWLESSTNGAPYAKCSPDLGTDTPSVTVPLSAAAPDFATVVFRAEGSYQGAGLSPSNPVSWEVGLRGMTSFQSGLNGNEVDLFWSTDTTTAAAVPVLERQITAADGSQSAWAKVPLPQGAVSFVDQGVSPGQERAYRIHNQYQASSSPVASSGPVVSPLPPPAHFQGISGQENLELSWDALDPNTQSVKVYSRAADGSFSILIQTLPGTAVQTTLGALRPGAYELAVAASTATREYLSAPVTVIVNPIFAPTLSAATGAKGKADLAWVPSPGSNPVTYKVLRTALPGFSESEIAEVGGSIQSYSDVGPAAGIYAYRIEAEGAYSSAASAPLQAAVTDSNSTFDPSQLSLGQIIAQSLDAQFGSDGRWWITSDTGPPDPSHLFAPGASGYQDVPLGDLSQATFLRTLPQPDGSAVIWGLTWAQSPWNAFTEAGRLKVATWSSAGLSFVDVDGYLINPQSNDERRFSVHPSADGIRLISLASLYDGTGAIRPGTAWAYRFDPAAGSASALINFNAPTASAGNAVFFSDGSGRDYLYTFQNWPPSSTFFRSPSDGTWDPIPQPPSGFTYNPYLKAFFVPLPDGFGLFYQPDFLHNGSWYYQEWQSGSWTGATEIYHPATTVSGQLTVAGIAQDGSRPTLALIDGADLFLVTREAAGWTTTALLHSPTSSGFPSGTYMKLGFTALGKRNLLFTNPDAVYSYGHIFQFAEE